MVCLRAASARAHRPSRAAAAGSDAGPTRGVGARPAYGVRESLVEKRTTIQRTSTTAGAVAKAREDTPGANGRRRQRNDDVCTTDDDGSDDDAITMATPHGDGVAHGVGDADVYVDDDMMDDAQPRSNEHDDDEVRDVTDEGHNAGGPHAHNTAQAQPLPGTPTRPHSQRHAQHNIGMPGTQRSRTTPGGTPVRDTRPNVPCAPTGRTIRADAQRHDGGDHKQQARNSRANRRVGGRTGRAGGAAYAARR